jgi:hypothetical protein
MSQPPPSNSEGAAPRSHRDPHGNLTDKVGREPSRTVVPDDDAPGVPGFRTWRGVYLFVLGSFIAMVLALTLFTRCHA